jgi:hypothetical protein
VPFTSVPGPGHYNAEKVDIFPIYKYKPSSVFVSKVARDNHGKSLKTHSAFPTKNIMSTSHQDKSPINPLDDDYYDEDDEEDGKTPGPGAYWNP